jgi:hypothetical protein
MERVESLLAPIHHSSDEKWLKLMWRKSGTLMGLETAFTSFRVHSPQASVLGVPV